MSQVFERAPSCSTDRATLDVEAAFLSPFGHGDDAMVKSNWEIRPERPDDVSAVLALQAAAFGPGRFARTAFRVREDVPRDPTLCFIGSIDAEIAASVWMTPIYIGETPAFILGPLSVRPRFKNRGLGKELVRVARRCAHSDAGLDVLLVGDRSYYEPLGFAVAPNGSIRFPGPVDPARIMIATPRGASPPSGPVRGRCDRDESRERSSLIPIQMKRKN